MDEKTIRAMNEAAERFRQAFIEAFQPVIEQIGEVLDYKEQNTPMQERNLNKSENDKPKCSGTFCQPNRNFDPSDCNLTGECDYYMPVADTSGMETVVDMAIKQFGIDEADKEKLRILFNAYVAEYMSVFCVI